MEGYREELPPGLQSRPDEIHEPAYASLIQRGGNDAIRTTVIRSALMEREPARDELQRSRSWVQLHLTLLPGRKLFTGFSPEIE